MQATYAFLDNTGAYYTSTDGKVNSSDINVPLRPTVWHEWLIDVWLLNREAAQAALTDAINEWRTAQEQSSIIFEHNGRRWDGGLRVLERIKPARRVAERTGSVIPDFFWTDAANNDVPMTLAELVALDEAHDAAIVMQGWKVHAKQRELKQQLNSLTDEHLLLFALDPSKYLP